MRPVRPKTPRKTPGKSKSSNKDPIVVYCRIRPLDKNEQVCAKAKDNRTVVLYPPEDSQYSRTVKECSFSHVFGENTSQKQLFDQVTLPLVQDLLQGNNGLLFTYGITSSGKTYTMTGSPDDGGFLPRSLDVIFNSIKDYQARCVFKPDRFNGFDVQSRDEAAMDLQREFGVNSRTPKPKGKEYINEWSNRIPYFKVVDDVSPDMNYSVFISYVEIYNNYIYDLLEKSSSDVNRSAKLLREDAACNMYVFGAVETEVHTVDGALELFNKGQLRRKVANTALNAESSRSHSVFTIRVVQAPLDPQGAEILQDKDQIIISQLSLVDLAGSERPLRTRNVGQKLREAGNINASLMTLRNCIEALRESQSQGSGSKMVPYRESKLTHLFRTFFEGEGKIRMVVCVNPRSDDYEENIHVMRFAEMTQEVLIARSTPVTTPNVLGLRSGRGNLYREAVQRAKEQGVSVTEVLAPVVYSLGPDFPDFSMDLLEDEVAYANLVEFLVNRQTRRQTFIQDLVRRQDDFRRSLIAVDEESNRLKQERTILQMDLNAREQQVQGLERKLSSAEHSIDILEKKLSESQRDNDNFKMQLEEGNRVLHNQNHEMENIKMKMHEKLAVEKDRMRRIMERRLAEKQAELEGKMCFTDEKFRQLREILNADDWEYLGDFNNFPPLTTLPSTESSEISVPQTRPKIISSQEIYTPDPKLPKSRSALDFVNVGRRQPSQPSSNQLKNDFDSLYAKENKPPSSSQRSVAIANLRHRRSQSSSGDVWVEHKPVGNLELNTVLQTAMKKRKSVTKLKIKDITNKDASKYVLEHQEQDSQGDVETQLYKGDIIPSASGGAQVVFNDVEKLRQESPPTPSSNYNLRKRSSEGVPLREIEDRCTVAVECHGLPSKIMKKK